MSDKLPYLLELEDEMELLPLGEWFDELIWSPSQCYYRVQHHGVDYILYLRWRWTDPWQAYVVKNTNSLSSMNNGHAVWSGDVFEMHDVQYEAAELELAKDKLISLFYEFDGDFTELRLILQEYDEYSRRDVDGSIFQPALRLRSTQRDSINQ